MSLWEAEDGLEGVTGFLVPLPDEAILNESPFLAFYYWFISIGFSGTSGQI